jgi:biopolymer transport protein ExbD
MAFGGGLDEDDDVVSEINMTPLVDVMLVLLIIFILTVPVITHSVKLDLPQASTTPAEPTPGTITIAVTAEGTLYWNATEVTPAELEARLKASATGQPQPDIQLRGDRKVEYEHVIRVMAMAQQAGLQKLGFITDPDAPTPSP